MKSIVFIAYSYNNPYLPDGIQNRRLARGLKECNIDLDIVCRDSNFLHEKSNNIYYIKSLDLRYLDRVLYLIFPFLYPIFSIDKLIWSFYCLNFFSKRKYDYILATYEPFSLMYLMKSLKRRTGASIIQLLYDPLFDNPFYSSSKMSLRLRRIAEEYIVNLSDLLLLNSELLYNQFCLRYSTCKSKFRKLYLCGDENVLNFSRKKVGNGKIKVVHAGNLHGCRSILPIVLVAQNLRNKYGENLPTLISFEFYGHVRNKDLELVCRYGLNELFHFHGFVNQDSLYPILCDADVLLILDSLENRNFCFPSKLCEYLFTQNMLIAFTPIVSATREIIKLSENYCFTSEEVHECYELFVNIIGKKKKANKNKCFEAFVPYKVAKQLLVFINAVIDKNDK